MVPTILRSGARPGPRPTERGERDARIAAAMQSRPGRARRSPLNAWGRAVPAAFLVTAALACSRPPSPVGGGDSHCWPPRSTDRGAASARPRGQDLAPVRDWTMGDRRADGQRARASGPGHEGAVGVHRRRALESLVRRRLRRRRVLPRPPGPPAGDLPLQRSRSASRRAPFYPESDRGDGPPRLPKGRLAPRGRDLLVRLQPRRAGPSPMAVPRHRGREGVGMGPRRLRDARESGGRSRPGHDGGRLPHRGARQRVRASGHRHPEPRERGGRPDPPLPVRVRGEEPGSPSRDSPWYPPSAAGAVRARPARIDALVWSDVRCARDARPAGPGPLDGHDATRPVRRLRRCREPDSQPGPPRGRSHGLRTGLVDQLVDAAGTRFGFHRSLPRRARSGVPGHPLAAGRADPGGPALSRVPHGRLRRRPLAAANLRSGSVDSTCIPRRTETRS